MHFSCDFWAIFSLVWRAFRQLSFKFKPGQSQKVPDMSQHSARCQIILCKQTTSHRHSATVSLESSPLVTAHGVVDNEEPRWPEVIISWLNKIIS